MGMRNWEDCRPARVSPPRCNIPEVTAYYKDIRTLTKYLMELLSIQPEHVFRIGVHLLFAVGVILRKIVELLTRARMKCVD
mmetsp:Transcript_72937/g.120809  ORF Transcript_72937/g.120809 Transcript_72937/m.120809 type:complete len:81 (-) Transcript_72937:374-616(-)